MLAVEEVADQIQHIGPRHAPPGVRSPSTPRDQPEDLAPTREMVVHHRTSVGFGADVENVTVLTDETDPRRTTVQPVPLELGVELALGPPVVRLEGTEGIRDIHRVVVGR